MSGKVAVVTGSNKGIGFSIVEGLLRRFQGSGTVYLTAREEARGREAVAKLNALGLHPAFHQLDVTSRSSIEAFRDHLQRQHGGIDLLVNNAAICDPDPDYESSKRVIDTNYYSVRTMQELVFPLVRNGGRILNISSDCGHLSNVRNEYWIRRLSSKELTVEDIEEFVQWYLKARRTGTWDPAQLADRGVPSYRVAKVALSALTVVQQRELAARGVSVCSVHPGLVRTDMTAGAGFYSAEQAARTPLRLLLDAPAPRAPYVWHDGTPLDWYDHTADYYFKLDTLSQ